MKTLEQEVEDLKKQLTERETARKLQEEKRVLECKLQGVCQWCGEKHDPSNSFCSNDGVWP